MGLRMVPHFQGLVGWGLRSNASHIDTTIYIQIVQRECSIKVIKSQLNITKNDLPASRISAGTLLGDYRQADVLSIFTSISLASMIEKYKLPLYFYVTKRQFFN